LRESINTLQNSIEIASIVAVVKVPKNKLKKNLNLHNEEPLIEFTEVPDANLENFRN